MLEFGAIMMVGQFRVEILTHKGTTVSSVTLPDLLWLETRNEFNHEKYDTVLLVSATKMYIKYSQHITNNYASILHIFIFTAAVELQSRKIQVIFGGLFRNTIKIDLMYHLLYDPG
jgi:hypothetical protein